MHRGDDAYVRSALPILADLGFAVDQFTPAEAKKKYPQIDFSGVKSIYLERRAGALSARRACGVVRDAFVKAGGTYRVGEAKPVSGGSSVELGDGSKLEADVFVFACGPWLGKVFPDVIGDRVHPSRQEVYYFGTPRGSERFSAGHLPIWIDFGKRIFYGLPDLRARGFKIADDTRGDAIDPTTANRTPTPEGIERARQLIAERFPGMAKAPLISAEVCQYENSPDGHLIIDRHPLASNTWLLGGGSGHGFKLSPAVGDITARAILNHEPVPPLFSLSRLHEATKTKTQFESKR